ncbi:hypothetical protein [Nostoc sp. FACHB-110]|uniref:hypothetical protein n=1 Tax=Nostoc sp. FACHB-110 TaxID=2692834 RepID=UPI0016861355|nr:hypothetical protein [Nostoc sp. FACHB-110]MBD2438259.1 hypothetical protein [Nostoc sp. FACHB-110]
MKINELPEITAINPDDYLIVYDVANNITGKIKASNLNLNSTNNSGGNNNIETEETTNLWLPSNTGIQLWLDANNLSSLSKDGNDYVSQWNDISGNGNNFTQSNQSKKPKLTNYSDTITKKALTFDGIDDYIKSGYYNYGTNITMYFVAKYADSNRWGLFDGTPNTAGSLRNYLYISNPIADSFEIQGNNPSLSIGSTAGEWSIFEFAFSLTPGRKIEKRVNGGNYNFATSTNTDNGVCNEVTIGAINYNNALLNGSIAEIIFLYSPVSETIRQKIEGYLANKWRLKSKLPVGHPYKTTAPTI